MAGRWRSRQMGIWARLSGNLSIDGATLRFLSGLASNRTVTLNAGGAIFDAIGGNTMLGGTISGSGEFSKTGTGTLTLGGINTYNGGTTISGGALMVNGSIVSAATVNSGGILGGGGSIFNNVTVNSGGMLAPGNGTAGTSLTVQGNLALQSGAQYLVQLNLGASSSPPHRHGDAWWRDRDGGLCARQ